MKKNLTYIASLPLICIAAAACSGQKEAAAPDAALPRDLQAVSQAMTPANPHDTQSTLEAICTLYAPWHEVSLQGKMSMKGLPLDPSAKIYMIRGRQILVSVRAPIIGEVARVEIADGEILLVNRMKKVYAHENLDRFLSAVDMSVEDLQDIFLGRVFVLGQGTLSQQNQGMMAVTRDPADGFVITPKRQPDIASYGFTLTPDYLLQVLFAESADGRYSASALYTWRGENGKKDVDLTVTAGDLQFKPEFSFQAPDFSPKPLERVRINSNWKKVSVRELMRF